MPGCAENIVNTLVFIIFPVLRKLEVWVSRGGFGCHLGGFLVTPGSLFPVFEGAGKLLEIEWIFMDSRGGPKSCAPPGGGANLHPGG